MIPTSIVQSYALSIFVDCAVECDVATRCCCALCSPLLLHASSASRTHPNPLLECLHTKNVCFRPLQQNSFHSNRSNPVE